MTNELTRNSVTYDTCYTTSTDIIIELGERPKNGIFEFHIEPILTWEIENKMFGRDKLQ